MDRSNAVPPSLVAMIAARRAVPDRVMANPRNVRASGAAYVNLPRPMPYAKFCRGIFCLAYVTRIPQVVEGAGVRHPVNARGRATLNVGDDNDRFGHVNLC